MLLRRLLKAVVAAEGRWFDVTRRVRTGGYLHLDGLTLAGSAKEGFEYMPVRPRNARAALSDLPVRNLEDFLFVDLGSGKGRILFLAAEHPFKKIIGVEFAAELHRAAVENILRYRCSRQRCRQIESVNTDAVDFVFPDHPLVIALYNPFGPAVLRKVLDNLKASAAAHPRPILLILLYPEFAEVVDTDPDFQVYKKTRNYYIFQWSAHGVN